MVRQIGSFMPLTVFLGVCRLGDWKGNPLGWKTVHDGWYM